METPGGFRDCMWRNCGNHFDLKALAVLEEVLTMNITDGHARHYSKPTSPHHWDPWSIFSGRSASSAVPCGVVRHVSDGVCVRSCIFPSQSSGPRTALRLERNDQKKIETH